MSSATEQYLEVYDRIHELNQVADNQKYSHEERNEARTEREPLIVKAGELFGDMLDDQRSSFVAEPVVIDRGLSLLVTGVLIKLRHQIEREMERSDLTPYMWSTLKNKYDALSKVFRMFEGRPLKKIGDWIVDPEYLLTAEYHDDSVDFKEAFDTAEARELENAFVEDGAVVNRYRVFPEHGNTVTLFYPILPHENVHRTMTRRAYEWVVRVKKPENLNLPDDPSEWITPNHQNLGSGDGRDMGHSPRAR